ncbi:uncharacterized protein N0V89_000758 [Didymosphaeria variabile]|uniref:Uncharacterized protein n=1 Tax=Didymosphaeria variabile TaxID=1932322 RepID=A0A9W9CF86_9PLEO|nr:uncharacterized protein N0V89_000758 [Didymosphaeria variabile]KAJ4360198.1 hypothetical protein N0V89_000758 [Didymosphaeria variabile]
MTKKKPQPRSGSATVPIVNKEERIVNTEILPSGGLALPQDVAQGSATTTPGAATPASETLSRGDYFAQFEGFTSQMDAGFLNQFNKLAIHEQ